MATHIINVSFGLNRYVKTKAREKHSYGQEIVFSNIKLPEVFEVYFSDSPTGKAKTAIGRDNKVLIPDEYFLSGKTIYCYILIHDTATDGRMKYTVEIPIEQRPEPTSVALDPVQQDIATEAIAALQSATERVEELAEQVSDHLSITERNVNTTNTNVEQSASNAELAHQYAENANEHANTALEYASLAETYKIDAERSRQGAISITDDFRLEVEDVKTEISRNINIANTHAETAKTYAESASSEADLAEIYSNSAEQSKQEAESIISDFRVEIEDAESTIRSNIAQGRREVEGIVEDFRSEAEDAKSVINGKVNEASGFANNAKGYADDAETSAENAEAYSNLAEETVREWINEGSGRIVTVAVSGMNPKINAVHNTVYICGEVISLDFTPCVDGVCDVIFTSGTTPTLLTMPDSVKLPKNFTILDNRTYEINILNGIYGVATSWA